MGDYREVQAGSKPFKRAYIAVMLWFVGRAIQAAARVDKAVREEFEKLPEGFTFSLGVQPHGPYMIVGKNQKGRVKYLGWKPESKVVDLRMAIKNIEAALLLFTFQESTAISICRDRIDFDGDLPPALTVIRAIGIVEVYLLPKLISKLAIKRYPVWSFGRKYLGRIRIYFHSILGY
ncbi:MAG: hypothetical protein JXC33_14280 [Deltaproteobacteria bacterium]|nr:hypothetical protein [Deltaproteobacteria bacterium]